MLSSSVLKIVAPNFTMLHLERKIEIEIDV